jgi:hypothetical protein
MPLSVRAAAIALIVILSPTASWAQSWLYSTSQARDMFGAPAGPVTLTEVAVGPNGPSAVHRVVSLPGRVGVGPVVTFDGRYVAFTTLTEGSNAQLTLFDRRSGQITLISGFATNGVLRSDPTALRLFFLGADQTGFATSIAIVEPGGVRHVAIAPVRSIGPLSLDGRDLFVVRHSVVDNTVRYRIVVMDPLTGLVRRELPPFPPFQEPTGLTISRDGQRLYLTLSDPPTVKVLDASSGAELATRTIALNPFQIEGLSFVRLDEQHDRLFVTRWFLSGSAGGGGSSFVLDPSSLQDIAHSNATQHVVDRPQRLVVSVGVFVSRFSGCGGAVVETWGAANTPQSTQNVPLDGGCPTIALATAPDAPDTFSHVVTGRQVTLTWSPVPGALDYQLEAGSGTGLAHLVQLRTGPSTSFVVDNVPAGTYYVRVRAVNDVGVGSATVDRMIVVP